MEAKVSTAISEQLKAVSEEVETQRLSLARKRLLLDRVCHNWSCVRDPAPPPSLCRGAASTDSLLAEPVMVPLDAAAPLAARHRLRSADRAAVDCTPPPARLRQRLFADRWVLVLDLPPQEPDSNPQGLLPVVSGGLQMTWVTTEPRREGLGWRLVAHAPLPEFTGTEEVVVSLFLLADGDRRLPAGEATLRWEDVAHGRIPRVPESWEEMEGMSDEDRAVALSVLDAVQHRVELRVSREALPSVLAQVEDLGLTPGLWVSRPAGLRGCRLATSRDASGGRISAWGRSPREAALLARWLRSALAPGVDAGPPRPPSLRAQLLAEAGGLLALVRREAAALVAEAGGPPQADDRGLAPLLQEMQEAQRAAGTQKLPKAARERLREGAREVRASCDAAIDSAAAQL